MICDGTTSLNEVFTALGDDLAAFWDSVWNYPKLAKSLIIYRPARSAILPSNTVTLWPPK